MSDVTHHLEDFHNTVSSLRSQLEQGCADPSECTSKISHLSHILKNLKEKGCILFSDLRLDDVMSQIEKTGSEQNKHARDAMDKTGFLQDLIDQLSKMSMTDGLTGLYNRRYFKVQIGVEFKRAIRFEQVISLVMLDIDYFKSINDTYGHPFGDAVLRRVGKILNLNLRASDIAVRYGGEEFAVILPNTDIEQAYYVTDKIRQVLGAAKFTYNDEPVKVTISAGVTSFNIDKDHSSDDLILRADKNLYMAKEMGRNRVYTDRELAIRPMESEVSQEEKIGLSGIIKE